MVLQGAAWSSFKRQLRFYKIFKDKHSSINFLLGEMPFDEKVLKKIFEPVDPADNIKIKHAAFWSFNFKP